MLYLILLPSKRYVNNNFYLIQQIIDITEPLIIHVFCPRFVVFYYFITHFFYVFDFCIFIFLTFIIINSIKINKY